MPICSFAACTGSGAYRDPAGWTAEIPEGQLVLPFEIAEGDAPSTGTQISNVELPSLEIHPSTPETRLGELDAGGDA